jgi:hypothetical protein
MSQRHANRRGWLRNRRAVTLDDDGLVIEPWLGRPRRIPWADVRAVQWRDSHRAEVQEWQGGVVLDDGLEGFGELVAAIEQRVAEESERAVKRGPHAATIERWLGGPLTIYVPLPSPLRAQLVRTAPPVGAALGLLVGLILDDPATERGNADAAAIVALISLLGYALGHVAVLVLAPPLLWLMERFGVPDARPTLRVQADGQGLACGTADVRHGRWSALCQVRPCAEGWELRFGQHEHPMVLPDHASLKPILTTAQRVLRASYDVPVEDQPVSEAALSRMTGAAEAEDRGLSRSEKPS